MCKSSSVLTYFLQFDFNFLKSYLHVIDLKNSKIQKVIARLDRTGLNKECLKAKFLVIYKMQCINYFGYMKILNPLFFNKYCLWNFLKMVKNFTRTNA